MEIIKHFEIYITAQKATGIQFAVLASDDQLCDGTNIVFTSTITPALSASPTVESVPLGAWGETVTKIQSYNISSDGTTSPAMSNLSRYLHGTTKPTYGTYVEFTGSFTSTSQAAIYTKGSAGAQSVDIQIDGVSQGVFAVNGTQNHSVPVSAGTHTIKFIGVGKDWIEVEKYLFTDVAKAVTYQWYLNSSPMPGEEASTFTSTTLNDADQILVKASSGAFNCFVPEITSNTVTMNCLATSTSEISSDAYFSVYPNPSAQSFIIESDYSFEACVYDLTGKLERSILVLANELVRFGADLSPGIYMVVDASTGKTMKLIKQ